MRLKTCIWYAQRRKKHAFDTRSGGKKHAMLSDIRNMPSIMFLMSDNRGCFLALKRVCSHSEKQVSNSFQIEGKMVMMTVLLLNMNPMEFNLVHNQNENCHHDHIPFNLKGIRNIFLWVQRVSRIFPSAVRKVTRILAKFRISSNTSVPYCRSIWGVSSGLDLTPPDAERPLSDGCATDRRCLLLLFDDNKVKMARKPGKKQKETPVGCTGED